MLKKREKGLCLGVSLIWMESGCLDSRLLSLGIEHIRLQLFLFLVYRGELLGKGITHL